MVDWHTKTFWTAEEFRQEAQREERLAHAADADGDAHYADLHRSKAREYREAARLKEVDNAK